MEKEKKERERENKREKKRRERYKGDKLIKVVLEYAQEAIQQHRLQHDCCPKPQDHAFQDKGLGKPGLIHINHMVSPTYLGKPIARNKTLN